jgi:hypothetical protein
MSSLGDMRKQKTNAMARKDGKSRGFTAVHTDLETSKTVGNLQ